MPGGKRTICVVTGSRADYGLLYWPLRKIRASGEFTLRLVVTGTHLSEDFGLSLRAIMADGFEIHDRIRILSSDDSALGTTKAFARVVEGAGRTFQRLRPDLLLLLGDRYEILGCAVAGLMQQIPIAHLFGGDVTEGVYDEAFRHAITKMSHLHFVTNVEAGRRVRQLGENPRHIFNVGSPGIDGIRRMKLVGRENLERRLGLRFRKRNCLITFHAVTLAENTDVQLEELLAALDCLGRDTGLVFTAAGADTGGARINRRIRQYVSMRDNALFVPSLGQRDYYSLIALSDVVVGNSSSGLCEVPSFKKPTVNVGDRQKGRPLARSVISCEPECSSILRAVRKALNLDCSKTVNPYGKGNASERIVAILKRVPDYRKLIQKHFFDVRPWIRERTNPRSV